MNAGGPESVRPTKRCLSDLGLDFPRLTEPLHSLDHPLVRHAQDLPQKCALNAAERVVAITDRVWWKLKTGQQRGMGGKFPSFSADRSWWIGAAGLRRDGDTSDFYAQITAECDRAGKGTGKPSSDHLLPQLIDRKRLEAEVAALAVTALQDTVRSAIAQSIRTGQAFSTMLGTGWDLTVFVASNNEDLYLTIVGSGSWSAEAYAVVLASVPGVSRDDWMPEPTTVLGLEAEPGQIIWSAMLSTEAREQILET